jgi:hypothetical protein
MVVRMPAKGRLKAGNGSWTATVHPAFTPGYAVPLNGDRGTLRDAGGT